MKKKSFLCVCLALLLSLPLVAQQENLPNKQETQKNEYQELVWSKEAEAQKSLPTTAGNLVYNVRVDSLKMPTKDGQHFAQIYCTSYIAKDGSDKRPILFCFNGGPGSSSVWLHLGLLGPKKLNFPSPISEDSQKPTFLNDKNSPLRFADLVFIDPISTGFSHVSSGANAKEFLGVDEDTSSLALFIERYLSHFKRWNSPKYLVGESYGTNRAVLLAEELHSDYFLDMDGLILISLAFDRDLMIDSPYNELALVTVLPSLSLAAQQYHLLPEENQQLSVHELYQKSKQFAQTKLAPALLQGSQLSAESIDRLAEELSALTGIPSSSIAKARLRTTFGDFCHLLYDKKNLAVGPFDTRISSFIPYKEAMVYQDPSLSFVASAFTTAFNSYLTQELSLDEKHPYSILNLHTNRSWNWISNNIRSLSLTNMTVTLQDLLCKIPSLKLYTASGLYDVATPPFAQELLLSRLTIKNPEKRITSSFFEGGHMMYLDTKIADTMNEELEEFILQKK